VDSQTEGTAVLCKGQYNHSFNTYVSILHPLITLLHIKMAGLMDYLLHGEMMIQKHYMESKNVVIKMKFYSNTTS
jgi:hypothetical protein